METWKILTLVIFISTSGFFFGLAYAAKVIGQIKYENERLNNELKRLTDRDERGRFVGDNNGKRKR